MSLALLSGMPRSLSADNAPPDARELVSAELLGQVKVRRALFRRALERHPPPDERRGAADPAFDALVALFERYDQSVGALVELLSRDTPSRAVESRPRRD